VVSKGKRQVLTWLAVLYLATWVLHTGAVKRGRRQRGSGADNRAGDNNMGFQPPRLTGIIYVPKDAKGNLCDLSGWFPVTHCRPTTKDTHTMTAVPAQDSSQVTPGKRGGNTQAASGGRDVGRGGGSSSSGGGDDDGGSRSSSSSSGGGSSSSSSNYAGDGGCAKILRVRGKWTTGGKVALPRQEPPPCNVSIHFRTVR
jgi:hypothetical protein